MEKLGGCGYSLAVQGHAYSSARTGQPNAAPSPHLKPDTLPGLSQSKTTKLPEGMLLSSLMLVFFQVVLGAMGNCTSTLLGGESWDP